MKRIIAALAITTVPLLAQTRTLFATLGATGTTSAANADANYHTVQAVPSGSPSGCTLRLEGSLDNSNWFDLSGSQTCTSAVMFHVDGKPATYVRVNLTALSGGTSPTVQITYKGQN